MAEKQHIINYLKTNNLKVTPQRMAILEAVYESGNHPTAEIILERVKKDNPNISLATVYSVLETLAEKKIINKVHTEKGVFRYDGYTEMHHHLHAGDSSKIEDYYNEELNGILQEYFERNKIPGFRIHEIMLHIKGEFEQ